MERGNPLLRFFDSVLGPVLLRLVALLRPKQAFPKTPLRHIAVIKAAALGDTVLVSALVSDLKNQFPSAQISLFVGGSNEALAKRIKGVAAVHRMPLKNIWRSLRILRSQKIDLVIDTDAWPRISALWAAMVPGAFSIGFKTAGQHRHFAYDMAVEHRGDQHEMENLRDLLRAVEIAAQAPPQNFSEQIQLPSPGEIYRDLLKFRNAPASVYCGLHLWPGGTLSYLKEWPLAAWAELIQKSPADWVFILTGGPTDRSRNEELLQRLSSELRVRCFNAAGCSLDESIMLLSKLSLLISVNTGVLHLAAAVGCPVVGLHGPTDPRRWGPLGQGHIPLLADHALAGTLHLGFEYPEDKTNVMPHLSVDRVLNASTEIRKRQF